MAEVAKALDRSAAASANQTCVQEEQKTAGDVPSASTTPATPTATTVASTNTALDSDSKTEDEAASSARNAELQKTFRAELELYTSGDQVDATRCYTALEAVFKNPEIGDMDQGPRNDLMLMLMNCVEGETRISGLFFAVPRSVRGASFVEVHVFKCSATLNGHCFRST